MTRDVLPFRGSRSFIAPQLLTKRFDPPAAAKWRIKPLMRFGHVKRTRTTPWALSLLAFASCSAPEEQSIAFPTHTYRFSGSEVLVHEPSPLFVRVRPPGGRFELVYDARLGQRPGGESRFFGVNDEGYSGVVRVRTPAGDVICRRASAPNGGCARRLWVRGVPWALHFPEDLMGAHSAFTAEARRFLDQRRTRAPAR